ncbi:Cytoplasmic dynein 2 light intermediate chain 1 [Symbiodinium microadriaticum]|uniref:Cytoplasmic dynein 2 light intermediate chain 1 n=1 Tax=Symbiodinium microadriaticum TaxID=2951 RepID=A0A1Q9CY06_SYMMI|nr:Cytoplasmic dynein 2 light intermediate chain 1 [Symbiodinium microadriaticum]CAE7303285.1 Dync2li1 [Symbiodinium microadriaticum]CAE7943243.1 Dync2li1 [Symbiodinium sp. KB8]
MLGSLWWCCDPLKQDVITELCGLLGAPTAAASQGRAGQFFTEVDRRTKWDVLASEVDPEKRKNLSRALRHYALVHGAHLVLCSLKEKASLNAMRSVLRQLLFGVAPKGGLPEQLDHSKPVCVAAGKDSVQSIGLPSGGQASERAWREFMQHLFPDPSPSSKGKKNDTEQPITSAAASQYNHGDLRISVRSLAGDMLCCLAANRQEPIEALKALVAAKCGISVFEQRLVVDGRELQSLKDLSPDIELDITLLRRPAAQVEWLEKIAQKADLSKAPDLIRNDREVLMTAVRLDDDALQWASPDLLGDRGLVLEAVQRCGFALACADRPLQADREVVLAAVARHGLSLEFAVPELRGDAEVVLTAIGQDGNAFQFASTDLRCNRDFVLKSVRRNGYALTYASPELRGDSEVVRAAIETMGWICECGKQLAQFGGWALQCADRKLQADRALVLSAVRRDGAALAFASPDLQHDDEVVLAAVLESGMALEHAAVPLRDDEAIVVAAVRKHGAALRFASERLRGSREVVLAAVRSDETALTWASEAASERLSRLRLKDEKEPMEMRYSCSSQSEEVAEELYKYPESSIDGMVEQRVEELQQYRRQVERNQRLASEGIEGNKVSVLSVAA